MKTQNKDLKQFLYCLGAFIASSSFCCLEAIRNHLLSVKFEGITVFFSILGPICAQSLDDVFILTSFFQIYYKGIWRTSVQSRKMSLK